MTEPMHEAAEFVRGLFSPVTNHAVFVTSIGNDRNDTTEAPRQVVTRDIGDITRFCTKWDRSGRGLFFCVGTLKPGQTRRAKDNISELIGLHADIDFKSIDIDRDEVLKILSQLRFQPSLVVSSGGGLHAYWLFREAVEATAETVEAIEAALRLLADLIGGDPAVCEISRLMRLPGTHNTKQGAWLPVETVSSNAAARYEFEELEEWLAESSPVIRRKVLGDAGAALIADNPFLAVAARFGFKPPIDVEQRLNAMSYQGVGDASIHQTQLQVSASLLSRGTPADDVYGILLDATRAAAGLYGERWNWRREERAIRKMCDDWLRKNLVAVAAAVKPVQAKLAPSVEREDEQAATRTNGQVVDLRRERAERAKRRPRGTDKQAVPEIVADGVIESVRQDGRDLLLTEGEVWVYADGVWHVMTQADQQWLQTLIQEGFETLGEPAKTANLNAAWKRLNEHPGLYRRAVPWAGGEVIIAENGVLDIRTGQFSEHAPALYARRKIGTRFQPGARCPRFETFVISLFADRAAPERDGFVSVIQTFFGAALAMSFLSREERKALILVGPSRTGKTELSRVLRRLIGEPIATPSVAEISERFGLASLYGAAAWIRDDAINEGDDLDPQRFKTIVTGEPIDIERKHKPAVNGVELALPVLLTTNALPRTRDKSDAIFNRSIVLEMTNVISEEEARRIRLAMKVERGHAGIGLFIFAEEGPGILNWALAGLRQLMERGSYDLPDTVRGSIQRFRDDNNPVGEWARTAVIRSERGKVARNDLMCSFHGWQREQDGEEARAFGGRGFFPRLRGVAPWIGDHQDHQGKRFVTGIALTDEGLQLWDMHMLGPQLKGGAKGSSMAKHEVNKIWSEAVTEQRESDANAPRF